VHGVGELAQLVLEGADLPAHLGEGLVALGTGGLGRSPLPGRGVQRARHERDRVGGAPANGLGHRGLALAALLAGGEALAGGELVAGRSLEGVGAALEGPGPLLLGTQREAQLGLRGTAAAGLGLEPVSLVGARVL
jgi:hypothetical protein